MRFVGRFLGVMFLVGSASVARAQMANDLYLDHSTKTKVVAWSKDGKAFAWRREKVQQRWNSMGDGVPATGTPLERSIIDVFVEGCQSDVTRKHFVITTAEDQSKAGRSKRWKAAEAWMKKAGYLFVAGTAAKPIENDLMETFEAPGHLGFPLPRRLLPGHLERLELTVGPSEFTPGAGEGITHPEAHLFVGMVGKVKGDPNDWQNFEIYLHHDGALPGLDSGTTCTVEYGPNSVCFVLTCTGPGAYTSVQTTQQSFRTDDLKKALPPADWSSHSEQ